MFCGRKYDEICQKCKLKNISDIETCINEKKNTTAYFTEFIKKKHLDQKDQPNKANEKKTTKK